LQACYYLLRVKFGSWVKPTHFLRGGSEALLTAFSTASSTATTPITFEALLVFTSVGLPTQYIALLVTND
jgi:DAACS family dicarboxylate/amino acid:cation (Na+ or H+) symporter